MKCYAQRDFTRAGETEAKKRYVKKRQALDISDGEYKKLQSYDLVGKTCPPEEKKKKKS